MNKTKLESLFEKRIYALYIDILIGFILIIVNVELFSMYMDLEMSLFYRIIFFIIPIFFYFNILPLITNGRTFGLYIMGLKIICFKKHSKVYLLFIYFLRTKYSILSLYILRIFLFPIMNSLGQFSFDEKFNISIVFNNDESLNMNIEIKYFSMNFHPLNFFKMLFFLIVISLLIKISLGV